MHRAKNMLRASKNVSCPRKVPFLAGCINTTPGWLVQVGPRRRGYTSIASKCTPSHDKPVETKMTTYT